MLSIPFMGFLVLGIVAQLLFGCLSIPFMGFRNFASSKEKVDKYNFQFPLWDSKNNTVTETLRDALLSIPFMGFINRRRY